LAGKRDARARAYRAVLHASPQVCTCRSRSTRRCGRSRSRSGQNPRYRALRGSMRHATARVPSVESLKPARGRRSLHAEHGRRADIAVVRRRPAHPPLGKRAPIRCCWDRCRRHRTGSQLTPRDPDELLETAGRCGTGVVLIASRSAADKNARCRRRSICAGNWHSPHCVRRFLVHCLRFSSPQRPRRSRGPGVSDRWVE